MFAHAQICDIILPLLLFGLVLYKLFDLARSHIAPWLRGEVEAENRSHLQLIEKDRFLNTSQKKIETLIEGQKRLFTTLEKNATAVQQFIIEKRDREEQELNAINEKLTVKRATQELNIKVVKQCEEVFAIALCQAHDELREHFITRHGSEHLDEVIAHLPKLHPAKD